ncbi:hypothetical protein K439DRAFT_1634427 [Ramaria rubella]|nr:hypothetical protein K439DRAFT_1634427 [Ramaria rubella]
MYSSLQFLFPASLRPQGSLALFPAPHSSSPHPTSLFPAPRPQPYPYHPCPSPHTRTHTHARTSPPSPPRPKSVLPVIPIQKSAPPPPSKSPSPSPSPLHTSPHTPPPPPPHPCNPTPFIPSSFQNTNHGPGNLIKTTRHDAARITSDLQARPYAHRAVGTQGIQISPTSPPACLPWYTPPRLPLPLSLGLRLRLPPLDIKFPGPQSTVYSPVHNPRSIPRSTIHGPRSTVPPTT